MRNEAFTLIEVMVVVVLMGLIAVATVWSLAGHSRDASREEVIGRIAHADRLVRMGARRLGEPCVLRIDLDRQEMSRVVSDQGHERRASPTMKVSGAHRIDRVVTPKIAVSVAAQQSGAETASAAVASGVVDIPIATGGWSASYALQLTAKDGDEKDWMLFAGLTGQMTRIKSEDEMDKVFAYLASGRPDAH